MTKRIGAFLFYDKDGIVGDYIDYLLEKMNEHLDKLIIICNGEVNEEGKDRLNKFAAEMILRENEGFDAGGWKYLFTEHLSRDELLAYDEIVLFNDSFFGPVYPLEEMFSEMDSRSELDFWGITEHGKREDEKGASKYGYFPRHIQSYFLTIRKNMFSSDEFNDYWVNMGLAETLNDAVAGFEVSFTYEFEKQGYKSGCYVDTTDCISEELDNINVYMYRTEEILKEKRCPFIKRKAFVSNVPGRLDRCDASFTNRCIDYIDNNTNYPIDLIWKQLIRTENIRSIYEAFHLDYILPEMCSLSKVPDKKIALVMHIYYPELFEYCRNYAASMPEYADIYITTSRTDYMDTIAELFGQIRCNKLEIIEVDGRGRDLSGLLVGARDRLMDYEYVCFIHDKMSLRDTLPGAGESFCNTLFESMLCSPQYVENIIGLFEGDKWLGVLTPPMSYVGPYMRHYCKAWAMKQNVENVKELTTTLDLACKISKHEAPITIGSAFWCRTNALKKLFEYEWHYTDFPETVGADGTISHALERIFGYVAQDAGYYTGVVYPTSLATLTLSNISSSFRRVFNGVGGLENIDQDNINTVLKSLGKKKKQEKKDGKQRKKFNSRKYVLKRLAYLTLFHGRNSQK